jgi:hypothetical protein
LAPVLGWALVPGWVPGLGLESHIQVLDIVPNPPPPPHPKLDRYHGSEWGATAPIDAQWHPTVTAIWSFMLGHKV